MHFVRCFVQQIRGRGGGESGCCCSIRHVGPFRRLDRSSRRTNLPHLATAPSNRPPRLRVNTRKCGAVKGNRVAGAGGIPKNASLWEREKRGEIRLVMKQCLQCGREYEDLPWLCKCGYEFSGSEPTLESNSHLKVRSPSANASLGSIILFLFGSVAGFLVYLSGCGSGLEGLERGFVGISIVYATGLLDSEFLFLVRTSRRFRLGSLAAKVSMILSRLRSIFGRDFCARPEFKNYSRQARKARQEKKLSEDHL